MSLDNLIDRADRLGVIGSPSSSTELALDILGTAVRRKLVGELALFRFAQDSSAHYALGQITEIQLRNTWHEDATMRSLIRQRGRVDAVSERQDTHLGKMIVSAVFRDAGGHRYEPSMLGTVPSTGTSVHVIGDETLSTLLRPYEEQLFYVGHLYGSTPKLPMWFKHFGRGSNGAGEAYHLGIFGKTGSGKSVLAKMVLAAYSRHPGMAMLIIDPQGEFARDMRPQGRSGEFALPLGDVMRAQGKPVTTLSVRNLVLDRWDLFRQILAESRFFRELQVMTGDKVSAACDQLTEAMRKMKGITLSSLHEKETFDKAWKLLEQDKLRNKVYAKEGTAAERFREAVDDADPDELYKEVWLPVARLFSEDKSRRKIEAALNWLLKESGGSRPVLVLDVSKEQAEGLLWNETIQSLVIKRVLDGITDTAEALYKEDRPGLNALVLIDEAHRLAPRELPLDNDESRAVRASLIDAVRTTRKYGLGWMFISQTLSSIHPEIVQQLRIFFFGFGLALGQEFQSLKQLVGSQNTALDLYQLFRDPHSSFDQTNRQYSWMSIGPVSPLSFAGTPLFFNAFNKKEHFMAANNLTVESSSSED